MRPAFIALLPASVVVAFYARDIPAMRKLQPESVAFDVFAGGCVFVGAYLLSWAILAVYKAVVEILS